MSKEKISTAGYKVTEEGRVFSTLSNWRGYGKRELTQHLDAYGYSRVSLTLEGKTKHFKVHKLVALYNLPPRPSAKHEIRHLDGNKENNTASNLAWGTCKDNAIDRERHGKTSRGLSHSRATKEGIRKSKEAEGDSHE